MSAGEGAQTSAQTALPRWLPCLIAAALTLGIIKAGSGEESTCFGTVSNGRLERGVRLPLQGPNFSAYSSLASKVGRTYVHSKVSEIVLAAYSALQQAAPGKVYVYGETGWAAGARIRPHRTHQNGLSVDFFVPVVDASGRSVPLPTGVANRYGYDIEFTADARFETYSIDFDALAEHLYQLYAAAQARGVGITRVILDPPFLPKLFAAPRGAYLQQHLEFMKKPAWVRHDEHYHVDFNLPCGPLSK
jgi:penicillin-insensitive murein endopeptidase